MNQKTAPHFLPLVKALADGKMLQVFNGTTWNDLPIEGKEIKFNAEPREYRIKPEPREFWIFGIECGDDYIGKSKRGAESALMKSGLDCKIIHVREVIEEIETVTA